MLHFFFFVKFEFDFCLKFPVLLHFGVCIKSLIWLHFDVCIKFPFKIPVSVNFRYKKRTVQKFPKIYVIRQTVTMARATISVPYSISPLHSRGRKTERLFAHVPSEKTKERVYKFCASFGVFLVAFFCDVSVVV